MEVAFHNRISKLPSNFRFATDVEIVNGYYIGTIFLTKKIYYPMKKGA